MLMVEDNKSYENFAELKRRVLVPAQGEINELTDITVSFEPILKGRKTIKVKFDMKLKNTWTAGSCAAIADKKLGKIQ